MIGDWTLAGDFFSSILAGLLLGWGADHLLGTDPWFVVIGIVLGSSVGFWRMYQHSDFILDQVHESRTLWNPEDDEDDA